MSVQSFQFSSLLNSETSPSSSLLGDYIGMESGFDLNNQTPFEIDPSRRRRLDGTNHATTGEGKMKRKNDFPPPIPMLARTENLPSHMPWILKRYYTNDGRLIICEEKVKHHEYFRAHRSNGRLTLQLVPLDDGVSDHEFDYDDEDDCVTDGEDERDCLSEDDHQAAMVERDGELRPSKSAPVIIGTSSVETAGSGKCCEYNHMRSPDRCLFGLTGSPTMKPIRS